MPTDRQASAGIALAPDWTRRRCKENVYVVTDISRLVWPRSRLHETWERVIWADADMLAVAPQDRQIAEGSGHGLARELLLHVDDQGKATPMHGIDNALMAFERGIAGLEAGEDARRVAVQPGRGRALGERERVEEAETHQQIGIAGRIRQVGELPGPQRRLEPGGVVRRQHHLGAQQLAHQEHRLAATPPQFQRHRQHPCKMPEVTTDPPPVFLGTKLGLNRV